MEDYVLALDFGGTKLASAIVERGSGKLLAYQKVATPAADGARVSLEYMCEIGRQSLRESGLTDDQISCIGISFGGPVSMNGRTVLKSEQIRGWDLFPLAQVIEKRFGKPARIGNDGNVAALGEWVYGSHRQPDHFAYMQLSTGIGGGLILNRRLFSGQGLASEMGHMKVPVFFGDPHPCSCGGSGCLESIAGGWALARETRDLCEHGDEILRQLCESEKEMSAKTLIESAHQGDPAASEILRAAFLSVSAGLANLILLLDLQEIVLGGSIAVNAWDLLQPVLEENIPQMLTTPMRNRTRVRVSELHGTETLLGAAELI